MWEATTRRWVVLVGGVALCAAGSAWVAMTPREAVDPGHEPATAAPTTRTAQADHTADLTHEHVRSVYAEHRDLVFERPVDITPATEGLVMRNRIPGMEDVPATAPELADRFHVTMPERGADAIEMHVTPDVTLRVYEDDVTGDAQEVDGAVSYTRAGGRVYWTGFENGFEEWLAIEEGLAHADRAVATWRVENATLRELGDGVMVTDASGKDRLYVTAPRAWNRSGEDVTARLRVEDQRIALHVDADGAEVLVDPLWRPTDDMVVPRSDHHVVAIPGGALALGGLSATSQALFSAETYDAATDTWSLTANDMAFARRDAVVVAYTQGAADRVLVAGGANNSTVTTGSEIYDVATRTFTPVADPMNAARRNAAGVLLPNGQILVTGGGDVDEALTSTELFNPTTQEWTPSGSLTYGRRNHQAAYLSFSGTILVLGGYSALNNTRASTEAYSIVTGTWTEDDLMDDQRAEFGMAVLGGSRLLVTGGVNTQQGNIILDTAEVFDTGGGGSWSTIADMNAARQRHFSFEYNGSSPEGIAWVIGNFTTQVLNRDSMGAYYWTSGPPMGVVRNATGMADIPGYGILAAGGAGLAASSSELLVQSCSQDNGGCSAQSACTDGALTITCGPCNAGYVSTDGTGNFTCTACPTATAYQPMAGQTACLTKTVCQPGTRVQSNGSITTNRTCTACTAGTNFSTTTNAASCTAVSNCTAGQFQMTAPTTSSDRVCSACGPNTFSTSVNVLACSPHSTCSAGSFVSTAPTASSDRGCSPCPSETFSNTDNVMACSAATQCGAGTRVLAQLTATSNRTCTACGAGTFSLGGNVLSCTPHTTCDAGQFVSTTPTTSADRGCSACPSETFSLSTNAATCTPATTCGAGSYVTSALTPSSDRTCSPCASGTFSSGSNATACMPHTDCQPGTYETSAPSDTADRACTPCLSGTYSVGINATSCDPVSDCQAGEYETSAPTSTEDRGCAPCDGGTFSNASNAVSCTACTVCGAGFVETAACTPTSDTECTESGDGDAGVPLDAGSGVDMGSGTPDGGAADAGDDAGDDAGQSPDASGTDGGRVDAGGMPPSSGGGCAVATDSGSHPSAALVLALLLTGLARTARRRRR